MEDDKNWNYDEIAEKLAMGRIDVDEAAIPLVLEEARNRCDGNVIARVASWYEDVKDDKARYLELAKEAAEVGSSEANFWLGHECHSDVNLPRDYEKDYSCFIKGKDVDWVPIDPEENADFERGGEVEVTSEGLLLESYGDIGWWLFVLEKHPSRALKCGLTDWYMKQVGDENRKRALKLLEESAKEGFGFARYKLAAL